MFNPNEKNYNYFQKKIAPRINITYIVSYQIAAATKMLIYIVRHRDKCTYFELHLP